MPITVHYINDVVGEYIADILVEERVMIELKKIEKIEKMHEVQHLNYRRATEIQIGILVNFKYTKAEIKRMVFDLPENPDDI